MTSLKRTLGLASLTLYGVGTILGAGIYSVLGAAAGQAGESLWLSFALSGAIVALTALSYAELATMYPKAGAELVYLRNALPRARAWQLVAGLLVVASGAATAATVALAFAGYLGDWVELPSFVVSLLLLAVLTGVALWGITQSAWVNAIFTVIEVGGLCLVIYVGFGADHFGDALVANPSVDVLGATALVFFAYLGFENIANLAEESKDPVKHLPLAILFSLALSVLIYVLVALAAVALLPPEQLAQSEAPLSDALRKASPKLVPVLRGIALFATANTALAALLSGGRLLYGMAKADALPARVAAVLPKRKTPWLATLLVAALAIMLVAVGELPVVASVSSFASLIAFASVHVALIVLRIREPDHERPFRVPLAIRSVPVLPVLGVVTTLGLITQIKPEALLVGAILIAVFSLGYLAFGRRNSRDVP